MTGAASPLCFDLSGFKVRFRGLGPEVAERFAERWSDYRTANVSDLVVDLAVSVEGEEVADGPLDFREIKSEREGARTRFSHIDGSLEIHEGPTSDARLAPGRPERQYWVLVNLLCAALGPRVVERGAVLLHAAAVVVDGRGFVLVAPEGGGKTTWADLARSAGATYLSDDVVLVDRSNGFLEVLSTPIRGAKPRPAPPGRFPVAALLLPRHGTSTALEPVTRLRVLARLEANVLFNADARPHRALEQLLRDTAEGTPAFELTFARDASFVSALRDLARPG